MSQGPFLSRRLFLGSTAALLATPALAQSRPWAARAEALDQLHALLVWKDGAPVVEEAFGGPGLDRVANVKSVSKTLVALLTGIAIDAGHIPGVDARILPMLGRGATGDSRDDLTVGDLLSMRGGLVRTSGGSYGAWVASSDWVDSALRPDPQSEPGGRFIYSTGGWHVLGAALSEATGDSLLSLARRGLGDPLGIEFAPWVRDPQGRYLGGNDMAVTPRGLLRIGEMVRRGGTWDGRQVVPERWLQTSWQPRARSPFSGDQYGYGWFLTRFDGAQAAYARGYGGQMLVVVPEREMVIAITSDPMQPARSGGYFGDLRNLVDGIVAEA
ncbi:serine hydrolase domain-containing protein [Alloyangia pacifica]|uniref:CubicO group peptidase, beta-lactamase class C family n=1 Tax=Alloyangia pacifica TaxID=311180 RepID=A0A1I6PUL7_9RHOB|nr:serine hydrolase [Alloyangia pacifica]SDG35764.1 CubicO group peptidase, beta-lactamase class C family [Alloyangia pacifica]SFS43768.1 CubicO group peptidase, beta-lactamase class C family [Alloyangia pacifica]